LRESDTEQYDKEVQELIISMLILKGSNHGRARTELQQQYAFGTMTDNLYPTTEEKVIFYWTHLLIITTTTMITILVTTMIMMQSWLHMMLHKTNIPMMMVILMTITCIVC
jgi:hypothetical protein